MTRLEYLEKKREMEYHNLLCYSRNYSMTVPKVGMGEQFKECKESCRIIEELLAEEKGESTKALVGAFVVSEKMVGEWEKLIGMLKQLQPL